MTLHDKSPVSPVRRCLLVWTCLLFTVAGPRVVIAQQAVPFDVLKGPIDNNQIYRHFESVANRMVGQQPANAVEHLQDLVNAAPSQCEISVGSLNPARPASRDELYEHIARSTLYFGELFNCGKCDRTHAGFAGGVLISEDGLALTNYHVLKSRDNGKTEGLIVMTWDGKCWPIEEVLFASKRDDVALVRLKAEDHRFHAAPLAEESPQPMEPVRILSHPYGEFFVMTQGEVSRYAKKRTSRSSRPKKDPGTWMEVTAPFGSGSSGSGVFNERGEIVGLVSSIRPLFRQSSKIVSGGAAENANGQKGRYVEMLIRMCVPLDAIRSGFHPD